MVVADCEPALIVKCQMSGESFFGIQLIYNLLKELFEIYSSSPIGELGNVMVLQFHQVRKNRDRRA